MDDLHSLLHVTECVFPDEIRYSLKLLSFTVGVCIVQPPNYIGLIKIEKPYRGRGFARFLFEHVRDELWDGSVQEIKLDAAELVTKQGKLVALYKSWGFMEVVEDGGAEYIRTNSEGELVKDVPMVMVMCLKLER